LGKKNRYIDIIEYIINEINPNDGVCDLVVAIEVIEHIDNFQKFLRRCTKISSKAIITSPNKKRINMNFNAQPPIYYQHFRE